MVKLQSLYNILRRNKLKEGLSFSFVLISVTDLATTRSCSHTHVHQDQPKCIQNSQILLKYIKVKIFE